MQAYIQGVEDAGPMEAGHDRLAGCGGARRPAAGAQLSLGARVQDLIALLNTLKTLLIYSLF